MFWCRKCVIMRLHSWVARSRNIEIKDSLTCSLTLFQPLSLSVERCSEHDVMRLVGPPGLAAVDRLYEKQLLEGGGGREIERRRNLELLGTPEYQRISLTIPGFRADFEMGFRDKNKSGFFQLMHLCQPSLLIDNNISSPLKYSPLLSNPYWITWFIM